jgi:hypothetical protein
MNDAAVRALVHPARPLVVGALLLRGCINGAFVVWLLTYSPPWLDVFRGGALYAIADGVVGLLIVGLIGWRTPINAPSSLLAVTLIDALLRLAAGAAILTFPGLPEIPITIVLFYGVIGAWAAAAGTIAVVTAVVAHGHAHMGTRPRSAVHAMFDPLSVEGAVALMLAIYALVVGPPSTADALRGAGAVASGSFAVVLLIAAYGVAKRPRNVRRA